MDQKPYFRLETRGGMSWFEVDCNLANDVVEIPWKRKLDPVTAHRGDVGTLSPSRPTPGFRSLGLGLRRDFGFGGSADLGRRRNFPLCRCRARGRLRRGLRLGKGHFLDGC